MEEEPIPYTTEHQELSDGAFKETNMPFPFVTEELNVIVFVFTEDIVPLSV
jgi:hypothetical protein